MSTLRTRRPTNNSIEMTTNPALSSLDTTSTPTQDTGEDSFFSTSGSETTHLVFPTFSTSRCCPCDRLICHKLIDTDDLILREERERLHHHEQSTKEAAKHLDVWDAFAEHAVETCICPLGLKQPTSCLCCISSKCGKGCCQHIATIWTYRLYQLMLLLVIIYYSNIVPISTYFCVGTGTGTDMFYCSKIQDCLAESNHTKAFASVGEYAGMRATMRALAESQYSSSWFVREGEKFSIVFKENATSPGFTRKQENLYLWWHAQSHSIWPAVIYSFNMFTLSLQIVAFIMVLSLKVQQDDPKEILFPALLESKVIDSPPYFDPKQFHFVRPKRMMWQLLFVGGMLGIPFGAFLEFQLGLFKGYTDWNVYLIAAVGPGMSICILLPVLGLLIQIHNSTTLANILIQLCSLNVHPSDKGRLGREVAHATSVHHLMTPLISTVQKSIRHFETDVVVEKEDGNEDEDDTCIESKADALINTTNTEEDEYDMLVQGSYERWMELYKTTVGALHIWSWRMTPVLGCLLINLGTNVFNAIVTSVFLFTGLETEIDLQGSRYARFQNVHPELLSRALAAGVTLVGSTLAIAMVSIRYKRLHVLVATLRVPRHRLDDFTVLQEYAAAVTIFDIPVNTKTVVAAYRLVFVQILLVALSAMRS